MEFRKMVLMILHAGQQKKHRCKEQTFGLSGRRHISFWIMFLVSSKKYLEVELLGCMVVLFLFFKRNSILFSIVPVPIYIPTKNTWGIPFLHICIPLVIYCLFDNSHFARCEVITHCSFDFHFPDAYSLEGKVWPT